MSHTVKFWYLPLPPKISSSPNVKRKNLSYYKPSRMLARTRRSVSWGQWEKLKERNIGEGFGAFPLSRAAILSYFSPLAVFHAAPQIISKRLGQAARTDVCPWAHILHSAQTYNFIRLQASYCRSRALFVLYVTRYAPSDIMFPLGLCGLFWLCLEVLPCALYLPIIIVPRRRKFVCSASLI